jgi:hypothetical protein
MNARTRRPGVFCVVPGAVIAILLFKRSRGRRAAES